MYQKRKTILRSLLAICLAAVCLLSLGLETKQATLELPLADTYEPTLEEVLYEGLLFHQETIDVERFNIHRNDFGKIYWGLLNNMPDLFHVNTKHNYRYYINSQIVTDITPSYNMSAAEAEVKRAEYIDAIQNISYSMNWEWEPMLQALYLHDYMALHAAYDESYTYYDPYNLLVNNTGVCQAYTMAYTALLNTCSIENEYISSNSMNHAWNRVTLYGNEYNVDVTWDDPTPNRLGHVGHNNFLCSDTQLSVNHSYTREEGYGDCTSNFYDDWFWRDVNTAILPYGEDFYFIKNGVITQWDTSKNVLNKCKSLSSKWYTGRSQNSYWNQINSDGSRNLNYSVLWPAGDVFLYNATYSIKSFDPRTNQLKTLYTYNGKDGCIFGFSYIDNTLTIQIGWNPNELNQTITINNFYV